MNIHLVVVAAFAAYAKGDVVIDTTKISAILASEDHRNVVRVTVPAQQGA